MNDQAEPSPRPPADPDDEVTDDMVTTRHTLRVDGADLDHTAPPVASCCVRRPTRAACSSAGQLDHVVDEIARRVLLRGGGVFSVESADLPDAGQPLTAILRYQF